MTAGDATCSFCEKSFREVGPLVEGPREVYICGECVELCQSIVEQEKVRRGLANPPQLTLQEIATRLQRYGCGPQATNEKLAAMVASRENRPCCSLLKGARESRVFLSRALAHVLRVPFASARARDLAAPPGELHPLWPLLVAADFNMEAAARGVVYVDGVDEPGSQRPLQELMQAGIRSVVPIPGGRAGTELFVDPANIVFLLGGDTVPTWVEEVLEVAPLADDVLVKLLSLAKLDDFWAACGANSSA